VKYPQVLRFLNQENQTNRTKFQQFLERGINEGFFRSDVNYELTTRLFDALGNYVMQNQLYRQFTIEEIFKNLIFVTLRGMCTARGAATLEEMIK
jgi:signal recognition particle GTPase